jgi:hypothetical protein
MWSNAFKPTTLSPQALNMLLLLLHPPPTPLTQGEGPIALVLAPTRELAEQIHREARRFAKAYGVQGGGDMETEISACTTYLCICREHMHSISMHTTYLGSTHTHTKHTTHTVSLHTHTVSLHTRGRSPALPACCVLQVLLRHPAARHALRCITCTPAQLPCPGHHYTLSLCRPSSCRCIRRAFKIRSNQAAASRRRGCGRNPWPHDGSAACQGLHDSPRYVFGA